MLHRICDTAIWGFRRSRQLDSILRVVAEAGFEGIEADLDTLTRRDPGWVRDQLALHGMKLAALRTAEDGSGVFDGRRSSRALERILDLMEKLDVPLLICRRADGGGAGGLGQHVAGLNRAAAHCRERGRRLLYLNGIAEFAHGSEALAGLDRDASPDLGFCVAVGALHKAGVPVVTFLRDHRERLVALHLQDFATSSASADDSVELGLGVVPLTRITAWMRRSRLGDIWVVADQAPSKGFPAQAVRRNGAFLVQELGQLGRDTP